MKYDRNIHRLAQVEVFPMDRIVRGARPHRLRPRATLLGWLAIAVLPWVAIIAFAVRRG